MQDNQRQALELSYLAGLIDGEGTIRLFRSKSKTELKYYAVSIGIGMVEKEGIELLQKYFGGNIREEIPSVPNRQKIYRWQAVGNKRALQIIGTLYPYLRIKKKQAEIAIEFAKTMGKDKRKQKISVSEIQRREDFYQKVRKLNAVGAAATTK